MSTNRKGNTGNTGSSQENTNVSAFPGDNKQTGTPGADFCSTSDGVWQYREGKAPTRICSQLDVIALTRNTDGEAWGRLLEWKDSDNRIHKWACPMELLAGDGMEFRRILMSMGLDISPGAKARAALQAYIQTASTDARALCVDKGGWHEGVYVLPDETIGKHRDHILLQTPGEPPKLRQSGKVKEWKDDVAHYCAGNSRLVLAVSAAFAAPLIQATNEESGGLHFVGPSSCGKTTALRVAASVWGGPEYLNRWRATANGLESIATVHNDALLILDELAQVEAHEAGGIAYMLANGTGKHRAKRDGMARPPANWRLLFLSAGEIGLADHMADAGKRSRAGQEVRLCDIPADTGQHGMFENLHEFASGDALADHLNMEASRHFGTPIRNYLRLLAAKENGSINRQFRQIRDHFIAQHVPKVADGQPRRVAGRFALVAAGGELATEFGITGWDPGEAIHAAGACFQAWLERRGGAGSQEKSEALSAVRYFIELHGDSRFGLLGKDSEYIQGIPNKAGNRRFHNDEWQYLFSTEVFRKDVCKGLDYQQVLRVLRDLDLLVSEPGRLTLNVRHMGRCYCVREAIKYV